MSAIGFVLAAGVAVNAIIVAYWQGWRRGYAKGCEDVVSELRGSR